MPSACRIAEALNWPRGGTRVMFTAIASRFARTITASDVLARADPQRCRSPVLAGVQSLSSPVAPRFSSWRVSNCL